jgi:uncharacterized coiled-coil DUF342 family protein
MLRVLAEHGDTEQVRHEIKDALQLALLDDSDAIDAVMAVVARIVAERDDANERWRYWKDLAVELRTELAAARQQLNQVRADLEPIIAKHERAAESASGAGDIAYAVPIRAFCQQLRKALDAPARPAGHGETGQS